MSEHLRHLSRHARIGVSCMPNAGLPQLTADGAHYPLTPVELADALRAVRPRVRARSGRRLLRHDAGAPAPGGGAAARPSPGAAQPAPRAGASSLYSRGAVRQDTTTCRSASGPTPTAPRRSASDAGGAAGTMRRDRPGADPRRRAPARPVRRLRRPRRRRRHARARRAGSPPRPRCRSCSTRPSRRCRGRAGDPRRAGGRSTRSTTRTATGPTPASPGSCRGRASTAPRWSR